VEGPLSDRERWDRRYAAGSHSDDAEPDWLDDLVHLLPPGGRALDVASGGGRVACWLARRGYSVTAADVSPVGLGLARERARRAGVALETVEVDLRTQPLPAGPWDVITCFAYLQRDLFPALVAALAPGGVLVCEISTVRNLERHERPSRRFLLEAGELRGLLEPLEPLHLHEGWVGGRAVARAIARRPARGV